MSACGRAVAPRDVQALVSVVKSPSPRFGPANGSSCFVIFSVMDTLLVCFVILSFIFSTKIICNRHFCAKVHLLLGW